MNGLPFVASRFFETPLAIHPGKAVTILSALGARVLGEDIAEVGVDWEDVFAGRQSAGKLGDPLGRRLAERKIAALDMVDGVAVVPVEGTLIHKGKWVGTYSGETSYEGLQTRIRMAAQNPAVKGVVFEIDSPGGEVSGAFDTAAMIRKLSAEKPTMAILTDHALSAGYLIASAARQIVIPETGRAGSIGVMMIHADRSKMLDKAGVRVSVLTAGKYKGEGNPFEPLPDAVAQRIRADLEQGRQAFARAVALGRGDRMSAEKALATEAEDFRGTEALALGLVDAVGHSSEAFDEFVRSVSGYAAARSYFIGAKSMTTPAIAAAAATSITTAEHETAVAQARETARAEGLAAGRAEGATAERARVQAILDSDAGKSRPALARHFAFETDMAPESASAALAAAAEEKASAPERTPLAAAMAAQTPLALGPGGDRQPQPTAKVVDTADIYARRAAAQGRAR